MFSLKKIAPIVMGAFVAIALVFAVSPEITQNFAFATGSILDPSDAPNIAPKTTLREGVISTLNYLLLFLGLIAVGYIIYAGILMVTSGGDDGAVKKTRTIILYAIVGIIIIFLSWTIVNWVDKLGQSIPVTQ